jgi:nitrous oxidase accessory protein
MSALANAARTRGWASPSGFFLAFYAAILLVVALALPWWRMDSRAPQYGQRVLVVSVSPTGVSGDLHEIDTLGHYVGMRSVESFAPIERKLAPFAVGWVALLALSLPFLRTFRFRLLAAGAVIAVPAFFAVDLWAWQRFAVTHLDKAAPLSMIADRVDARLIGEYAVAQFKIYASFEVGFWLAVIAAANVIGFLVAERSSSASSQPVRSLQKIAAAVAAVLVLILAPRIARAAVIEVAPGTAHPSIGAAIAAAAPGDEIVVRRGVYHEHLVLDRPLFLRGDEGAVVDGDDTGTLLIIEAGPSIVRGLTLRGSGTSLLGEDAAIRVVGAPKSVLEHNRVLDSLFGILVISSRAVRVADNHVIGKSLPIPRRGDGIRIFDSPECVIDDNIVESSRDLAIWNSTGTSARRNAVRDSRYGLHYMYSDDNVFEDNVFERNQVGGAIMYSRRLTLRRNRFTGSRGPSAHGLLLKAADDVVIEGNWFTDNTRGLFVSDTTTSKYSNCSFHANVIAGNEIGITLEPTASRIAFSENAFVANRVQVEALGQSMVDQNEWSPGGRGNYWSDYVGFDEDADGFGDVPYRLEQFFENLTDRWPAVGVLRLGPAAQALEMAARAFPIVKPRPTLVDNHPLVHPLPSLAAVGGTRRQPGLALAGLVALVGATLGARRASRPPQGAAS